MYDSSGICAMFSEFSSIFKNKASQMNLVCLKNSIWLATFWGNLRPTL